MRLTPFAALTMPDAMTSHFMMPPGGHPIIRLLLNEASGEHLNMSTLHIVAGVLDR